MYERETAEHIFMREAHIAKYEAAKLHEPEVVAEFEAKARTRRKRVKAA